MNRSGLPVHRQSFGAGEAVVMVHGWSMHSGIWLDFARKLSTRRRVTLVDLPGHGRSGTMDDYSLDAVVDAIAPEGAAHWIGWSLGALLSIRAASRYPERVRSISLLAGTPRFTRDVNWPGVDGLLLGQMADNLEQDFALTLKRFTGLQVFGQENARELARKIDSALQECPPPDMGALRGGLALLQGEDLRDSLSACPVPAMMVLGERDRLVPEPVSAVLGEMAPALEVNVLSGAAHLPFLTHESETLRLVERFLDRVDDPSAGEGAVREG